MTHELIVECNNYSGIPSDERCRTVEDYVREGLTGQCTLQNVKMQERQIQENLIQPTLTIRYNEDGNGGLLIENLDSILVDIGISAIKAVVSEITSRGVEGALLGGGAGLLAGGASENNDDSLATTVIGALIGGLLGKSIEKRILKLVAQKKSGQWITEEIPQLGGNSV